LAAFNGLFLLCGQAKACHIGIFILFKRLSIGSLIE
jgi:hypothetical protein